MITKFRLEAVGASSNDVLAELDKITLGIQSWLKVSEGHRGNWECTDDVIHAEKTPIWKGDRRISVLHPTGRYLGRRVMLYHPDEIGLGG